MGGTNKLLACLEQKPILHQVLDSAVASKIAQCIVVTGFDAESIEQSVSPYNLSTTRNPEYKKGMSGSLKKGIEALSDKTDGIIVLLGDMPHVDDRVIDRLIDEFSATSKQEIFIPVYKGKRGNPVLWSQRFFAPLSQLTGDIGGRQLIRENQGYVKECPVHTPGIHRDIDTLSDLAAFRKCATVPSSDPSLS